MLVHSSRRSRSRPLARAAAQVLEQLEPRQLFSIVLGPATPTALSATPTGDPAAPVIADFDNDTFNDVIVAYPSPSAVESGFIQFGKNDGAGNLTFSDPVDVGVFTGRPVVGDFDGDGSKDIAVTNAFGGQVLLLHGFGNGTFAAPLQFTAGISPEPLAVRDFNGDSRDDLVIGNRSSNTIDVRLGDATASLLNPTSIATGTDPASLGIGDFTGDGNLDILVGASGGTGSAAGTLQVFAGNGDGTFVTTPVNTPGPFGVSSTPDLNSDGVPDVVVGVSSRDRADVLINNGDGTFRLAKGSTGQSAFGEPVAADLNNDSRTDLLTATSGGIEVLAGNGDGTFAKVRRFNPGAGAGPAAGDLNGDGRADVLTISDTAGVQTGRVLNVSLGQIVGPDLSIQVAQGLPPALLNNSTQKVVVSITNNGNEAFKGEVPVQFYFSDDAVIDDVDTLAGQFFPKVKLGVGQTKNVKLNLDVTVTAGNYNLLTAVDLFGSTGDINLANNTGTPQAVQVAEAFIDLAGGTSTIPGGPLAVGSNVRVSFPVSNAGNIIASGKVEMLVVASTNNVADANSDPVLKAINVRLKLVPGASKTITLKFKVPSTLTPGAYFLIGVINTNGGVNETNLDNNFAPSAVPVTITA